MATDAAASPAPAGCSAMKAEFTGHAEYLNALVSTHGRLPFLLASVPPWIKPLLDVAVWRDAFAAPDYFLLCRALEEGKLV